MCGGGCNQIWGLCDKYELIKFWYEDLRLEFNLTSHFMALKWGENL